MRPVFLSHAGLWCGAGSTPAGVRRALAAMDPPRGRLDLPGHPVPYVHATDPARPFRARLEEALAAVGAALDLPLASGTPMLLGTSSLLIGGSEAGGTLPEPSELLAIVQERWGLQGRGWIFSSACTSAVHALDAAVGLIEGGQAEEAQAQLDTAKAQLSDKQAQVEADVRDALLDIDAAQKQVQVAQSSMALANEALKEAQERYANGVSDNLAVSQAQQSVAQADGQYVASLYRYNVAKLSLARALGAGQDYRKYVGGK